MEPAPTPQLVPSPVDGQHLRRVMGEFATGITVMSAGAEEPHGMTLNAFTSVSLDPPLILTCVATTSRMVQALADQDTFGLSVLAASQGQIAQHFASRSRPRGRECFDGFRTHRGPRTGVRLFSDALAWLECEVRERVVAGDHTVFIAEVLRGARGRPASPLLFHGGDYPSVCGGSCSERMTA